ncbi:MAG: serine hydrolase domain-containing protein [Candidatus Aminicenantales bacterium]
MKKMCSAILVLFLTLCATSGPAADKVASDYRVKTALEAARIWLEAQRAYDRIPGVSAAIVHDQQVLWSGGYGHADLAKESPAAADTIYSICSISKLFTSIAVMQLRDAGKLRLDDPLKKHLPWFKIQETAPEGPEITIEGLLTHASGLPRESEYPYWTAPDYVFPTREQVKEKIASQQTLYPAETHFQYSNLGITLAGEVVSAVSAEPFDQYVKSHILAPLGMSNTTPEIPADQKGSRLATGYSILTRDGEPKAMPFFQVRGIAPAAGFASTAEDLARFASWQFRLLEKGGTEILSANTLREMYRIHWVEPDFETTWGLGFSVWRRGAKIFVGHGGSCPGFRTAVLFRPEEKVAAIFLSNAHEAASEALAQCLYDLVAPAIKDSIKNPAAAKKPDAGLNKYLGTYSAWSGELAVIIWENSLAAMDLPTMNPLKSITKLKKTGKHTFRRIRDDEELGEEIVFEMGPDGRAARLKWYSNYYPRVR